MQQLVRQVKELTGLHYLRHLPEPHHVPPGLAHPGEPEPVELPGLGPETVRVGHGVVRVGEPGGRGQGHGHSGGGADCWDRHWV